MLAERWLARSDGLAARTGGHSLGAKPEAAVKGVSRPGGLRAHPTRAYLQFWGSGRFEWKVIGQGKRFSLAAAQIWLKVRNCFDWGLRLGAGGDRAGRRADGQTGRWDGQVGLGRWAKTQSWRSS